MASVKWALMTRRTLAQTLTATTGRMQRTETTTTKASRILLTLIPMPYLISFLSSHDTASQVNDSDSERGSDSSSASESGNSNFNTEANGVDPFANDARPQSSFISFLLLYFTLYSYTY